MRVLRPRNHPGFGDVADANDGRVVSNFVVQALRGEPLTIYGDGSQTRSFCFVDDLIEGLVRLGTLESAPDGPINLGNEREVSMRRSPTWSWRLRGPRVVWSGCRCLRTIR